MTQSHISYHINGVNTPLPDTLEMHLKALNPRWLLIKDNIDMARAWAHKLPQTQVIARNWALTQGDENVYRLSPEQWLDKRLPEATDGLWLMVSNEAGLNPTWDIALMKLVLARGLKQVKLVIGNYNVGTPELADWTTPVMREWFQLLDSHRDQFVLGLHEYFCGIAPSGFVGGYPDGSTSDGKTGVHPNYENRANWPSDASTIGQLWHCGRVMTVNAAARSSGLMPPRVVLTEHGADRVRDIDGWVQKFQPSGGYPSIRGWKSLTNLWGRLMPNKGQQEVYLDNVTYLDKAVYSHFPNVEAQLLYTWSSAPDWTDFDLSAATTFHAGLETHAQATPVINTPPSDPVPPVGTPTPQPTVGFVPTVEEIKTLRDLRSVLLANITIQQAQLALINRILEKV